MEGSGSVNLRLDLLLAVEKSSKSAHPCVCLLAWLCCLLGLLSVEGTNGYF